jgi:DNA-binding CsgD family transcriptional regulator
MALTHLPLRSAPSLTALTPREREIYHLAAAGLSASQIATHLHIEASTVRTHLTHIHHKLADPRAKNP